MIEQYDGIEIESEFTQHRFYTVDNLKRKEIGSETITVMTTENNGEKLRLLHVPDEHVIIQKLSDRTVSDGVFVDTNSVNKVMTKNTNDTDYNFPNGWGLMTDKEKARWFLKERVFQQAAGQDTSFGERYRSQQEQDGVPLSEAWEQAKENEDRFRYDP